MAAICFFLAAAVAIAQFKPVSPSPVGTPAPQQPITQGENPPPLFSVKVNLVRLLVSVRDPAGAVISNLERQDFRVSDNGVPQEIAVFDRNTSLPLSVAVMIDTSGCANQSHPRQLAGGMPTSAWLASRCPKVSLSRTFPQPI